MKAIRPRTCHFDKSGHNGLALWPSPPPLIICNLTHLFRWQKVVNPSLVKGPWTKEEDEKVRELVQKYGPLSKALVYDS